MDLRTQLHHFCFRHSGVAYYISYTHDRMNMLLNHAVCATSKTRCTTYSLGMPDQDCQLISFNLRTNFFGVNFYCRKQLKGCIFKPRSSKIRWRNLKIFFVLKLLIFEIYAATKKKEKTWVFFFLVFASVANWKASPMVFRNDNLVRPLPFPAMSLPLIAVKSDSRVNIL